MDTVMRAQGEGSRGDATSWTGGRTATWRSAYPLMLVVASGLLWSCRGDPEVPTNTAPAPVAAEAEAGVEGSTVDEPGESWPWASAAEGAYLSSTYGGRIVAGSAQLEVDAGALEEGTSLEVTLPASPEALDRPLPDVTLLSAAHIGPWLTPLRRSVALTLPLANERPPGEALELLAWQPSQRAFTTIAYSSVADDGRSATFRILRFGSFLVRPRPVEVSMEELGCDAQRLRIGEFWPAAEARTVGLTSPATRLSRVQAFARLTDHRWFADTVGLLHKNEEDTATLQRIADERNHQDEDFLSDPNAAAAAYLLAQLVQRAWVEPDTGKPAARLRITEAYDSLLEHSRTSAHYQGRALDLTLDPTPAGDRRARARAYGRLARLAICAGFDHVFFEDMHHVHASVTPTRIQWETEADGETQSWEVSLVDPDLTARAVSTPARQENRRTQTLTGHQEVRVAAGAVFWGRRGPLPFLGSMDADGIPLVAPDTVTVGAQGRALDAWIVVHRPTQAAWAQFHAETP